MGFFTDTDFDSSLDMIDAVNEVVERNIRTNFTQESATKLGLDQRCGRLYVDIVDEVIAVPNHNIRTLDYYGGFEYVKEGEGRITCGEYTFFTTESDRIADCFEALSEDMVDE
jgi:hypothetical protein